MLVECTKLKYDEVLQCVALGSIYWSQPVLYTATSLSYILLQWMIKQKCWLVLNLYLHMSAVTHVDDLYAFWVEYHISATDLEVTGNFYLFSYIGHHYWTVTCQLLTHNVLI